MQLDIFFKLHRSLAKLHRSLTKLHRSLTKLHRSLMKRNRINAVLLPGCSWFSV